VHDYLRVLYARAGTQHCHLCGEPVAGRSLDEVVGSILELPEGSRLLILAPVVTHRKGEFRDLLEELRGRGYVRARIDGEIHRLEDAPALARKRKHSIELVVDRVSLRREEPERLAESVELALREGHGEITVESPDEAFPPMRFSESRTCCGHAFPELSPQSFSFNSPLGMCPECNGLGLRLEIDPDLVVPDASLSIREGAIAPWASAVARDGSWSARIFRAMAKATGIDLDKPWRKLPKRKRDQVLHGLGDRRIKVMWGKEGTDRHGTYGMKYEGVIPALVRRYKQTRSEMMQRYYRGYMANRPCGVCEGRRLRPESLAVLLGGKGPAASAWST
jgi:excinuclease ABC subunit A